MNSKAAPNGLNLQNTAFSAAMREQAIATPKANRRHVR